MTGPAADNFVGQVGWLRCGNCDESTRGFAAAMVHRFNNWDAVCAELRLAKARIEALEQQ